MDKTTALQNLLDGTISEKEIKLLKQLLVNGDISIGGNVNHSVIIIGNGNRVDLTHEALDRLNARSFLGNLDRDLTGQEIALGLDRLESELPLRAPILLVQFQKLDRRLRSFLKTSSSSLSEYARHEHDEALAMINSQCLEALDISFNALCLGEKPPEYDSRSPFRGMESFRPEDSEFFFGREALTKKLLGKIQSHSFLAVLGASGSGKSSLVMAGLIPALGSKYVIFRPGTNPLEVLETVKENTLVVVDQFEELFTLTRDETTRKKFVKELLILSKKNQVIITMRADFWGEIAIYEDLKQAMQVHQELIAPMDLDELRYAMEAQAERIGLRFEADLIQQILDDVDGEPGAMSLLQHALWELWNRRHGHWLRAKEYRDFGGVKQAITSTAEKIYEECTDAEKEAVHDIFLRLTCFDKSEEARDTRKRVAISNLIPSGQDRVLTIAMLDKLATARLIVKTVNNEEQIEIEVTHEALIRYWERLRTWLKENRENSKVWERLSDAANEWEIGKKNEGLVNYRDPWLKSIMGMDTKSIYKLNDTEKDYLDACAKAKAADEARQKRFKQLAVTASISLFVILILGIFTGWSFFSSERAVPGKWVPIKEGPFKMGMDEEERNLADSLCQKVADDKSRCTSLESLIVESGKQEKPWLPGFSIMNNEVTNAQYQQCIDTGDCQESGWKYENGNFNQPATGLNWHKAGEYCKWLGGRLPTEGEWEKAARGPRNYAFPWGDDWDPSKANLAHSGTGAIQNILKFASTDFNSYGVMNMAGNVQEWTASEALPLTPGQSFENNIFIHEDDSEEWPVIIRGGSWMLEPSQGMASKRGTYTITGELETLGFRCMCPKDQICKSPWSWQWIWFGKY